MANYKQYQQVLNLSIRSDSKPLGAQKGKSAKKSVASTPTKRRTKTGCMTCRRRKKKCDEDKVDGKCQACTRNFLECCWPESAEIISVNIKSEPESEISSCCSDSSVSSPRSPVARPVSPHSHYPSPAQSPIHEAKQDDCDVKFIQLPPLSADYKVGKKRGSAFEMISKNSSQARFIVTSINNDKSLRQVV